MKVTFSNVTVTIKANSAKQAYDLLCNGLASIPESDYKTDSFSVWDDECVEAGDNLSTELLFLTEQEQAEGLKVRP